MHLIASVEWAPIYTLWLVAICVIGVPLMTLSFFVIRRLKELRAMHKSAEGDLYISDRGEMYAEYSIPIPEIVERDYILLNVHHITLKEDKDHGNISAETDQT